MTTRAKKKGGAVETRYVNYPTVKIGDHVVKFSYWNTAPELSGRVVAQTEHFVEVERDVGGFFFDWSEREWVSKANIEVVTLL